jgi:cation:H+ antiporter
MIISSFILSESLEKLKVRFKVAGGLLGMLTALCATTPEISSAITALFVKQHNVAVGIIIGSNIFNIAALLGISALIVGKLPVKRQSTLVNGTISLLVTLVLILLIFKFISVLISLLILVLLLAPYAIVLGFKTNQMRKWGLPEKIRTFLTPAITSSNHALKGRKTALSESWSWAWKGLAALIVIIVTSMGMVPSAVFISDAWGVNKTILGVLILALLTGIPDAVVAIKMAINGRGIAVMSETLNSNTLNILFGICIPAIIFGLGSLSKQSIFSVWWLLGTTILALLLLYLKKGFNRMSGAIIVGLYLVFAVFIIVWK